MFRQGEGRRAGVQSGRRGDGNRGPRRGANYLGATGKRDGGAPRLLSDGRNSRRVTRRTRGEAREANGLTWTLRTDLGTE